jgi:hypothetical protein
MLELQTTDSDLWYCRFLAEPSLWTQILRHVFSLIISYRSGFLCRPKHQKSQYSAWDKVQSLVAAPMWWTGPFPPTGGYQSGGAALHLRKHRRQQKELAVTRPQDTSRWPSFVYVLQVGRKKLLTFKRIIVRSYYKNRVYFPQHFIMRIFKNTKVEKTAQRVSTYWF